MRVSGIRAQRDREAQLYRGEMRGAMERFLTVNGFSGSTPAPNDNQALNVAPQSGTNPEFGIESTPYGVEARIRNSRAPSNDQGPCLYFGPQGQRCSRPAVSNGFCGRHMPAQLGESANPGAPSYARPGGAALGSRPLARIVAIGIAIFAALWPIVADLLREIIRWIHAH